MLPIEMFEAVIDRASDDPTSLRQLSLTCTAFQSRCRYHLFSRIVIRTVEQMESFPDFLDAHPWLLPLIHKVTISETIYIPRENAKPNVRVLDVILVYLLTRLSNLRTWTMGVRYDRFIPDEIPSLSLHHSALRCYQKYGSHIQNLELSWLRFDGPSDFTRLVSAFTSIRSLTCSRISFDMSKEPNSSLDEANTGHQHQHARPLQLRTLTVSFLVVSVLVLESSGLLKILVYQARGIGGYSRSRVPAGPLRGSTGKSWTWTSHLAILVGRFRR